MTLGGRQEVSNLIQMVTGHILAKFVTLATISMRRLQSFLICFELVCGIAVLLVSTGLALRLSVDVWNDASSAAQHKLPG